MLNAKTVLITGCSSGIGLAAAQMLQQRGYQVFAGVRKALDQERLQQLGLQTVWLDVNDSESIRHGVADVLAQTNGQLYALINNAGYAQPGALEDISRASLRNQFETNVFGLQELTNLVIPVMRRQGYGRIINLSSVLGLVTMAYRGAYCASKYAVEALSDCLRLELAGTGIFVVLIEPGPIKTAFRDNARIAYTQNIAAFDSVHQMHYNNLLNNIEQLKDTSRFTLPPEAVVKKLLLALEKPAPKIRYYVTVPAHLLAGLKRLLPESWLDALLRRIAEHETR